MPDSGDPPRLVLSERAAVHASPTVKPGARSVHRSEAKPEANVISFVESPKWT
jgi:hypothetical protein